VRELVGITATELQRERMLRGIEVEMMRHVAVRERRRGDHLGVEARMPRDETQEVTGNAGPSSPSSGRCKAGGPRHP
jgi:hypothetical protein